SRELKTVPAKDGKRPRISSEYHYLTSLWLKEFSATFPGLAVVDLSREHLTLYMDSHRGAAPKTRNARRGILKMFLKWAVEQDYLAQNHRLFESESMRQEPADPEELDYFRSSELSAMLHAADAQLVPVIALAALGGIRLREIQRLTWADIWRVH